MRRCAAQSTHECADLGAILNAVSLATSSRDLMRWICQLEDDNPFPLAEVDDLIAHARSQRLVDSKDEEAQVRRRLVELVDRDMLDATDPFATYDQPIDAENRAGAMSELRTTPGGRSWAGSTDQAESPQETAAGTPPDPRKVAVMHGRDTKARNAVYNFLRRLDLAPMEWDDLVELTKTAAPYNGEAVAAGFRAAQAVVVILTPDDVGYLHPALRGDREHQDDRDPTGQPRLNVVLEAGMALQSHPTRTVLVEIGHCRAISDLAGRNAVRLDGTPERLQSLASRLETAGCPVQRSGTEWMDTTELSSLDALTRRSVEAHTQER